MKVIRHPILTIAGIVALFVFVGPGTTLWILGLFLLYFGIVRVTARFVPLHILIGATLAIGALLFFFSRFGWIAAAGFIVLNIGIPPRRVRKDENKDSARTRDLIDRTAPLHALSQPDASEKADTEPGSTLLQQRADERTTLPPAAVVPLSERPPGMASSRPQEPPTSRWRFESFTRSARKVLSLAQEEAQRLNHNYIDTEHLLLGLIRDEGQAYMVFWRLGVWNLSTFDVERTKVRSAIELLIGQRDRIVVGERGLTLRARKVLDLAEDEARLLNEPYVGSEHLLLGLIREGEGIAGEVLESLGVTLEKARAANLQIRLSQTNLHLPLTNQFEAFTEPARQALNLAREEAQRFNHPYLGMEHLLLGLVREGEGVAAQVLNTLGVNLNKVRSAVEYVIGRGDEPVSEGISLTPRTQKVIEVAIDEAHQLNQHTIDTAHLLLGLVREGEGIAIGVLERLGINLEEVRTQTIQMLSQTSRLDGRAGPEHSKLATKHSRSICSFCGKGRDAVRYLIAEKQDIYFICNECVDLCREIIAGESLQKEANEQGVKEPNHGPTISHVSSSFTCSFCGKDQKQVGRLIAGPKDALICDECVDLCWEIIAGEEAKKESKEQEEDEQKAIMPKRPLQQVPGKGEFPLPEVGPLIRLFISSTFTDFAFEREVLQGAVFPRLRALCAAAGCRFQPIDLRWGVSEEAGNDKRTLAICLEEVTRCQRLSPDLNFLILVGERYGSCFLPEHIPSEQVMRLWPHLSDAWRVRFKVAYAEDQNALSPEYILRPGAGTGDGRTAEEALRVALAQAAAAASFSELERLPFVASATHLEIQRGLLDAGCNPGAALCAFRSFTTVLEEPQVAKYGEPQRDHRPRLAALKTAIEQKLGTEQVWRYTMPVESLVLAQDHAAQVSSPEYQGLAEQFYALLEPRIQQALALRRAAVHKRNPAALTNRQFAVERASVVEGRDEVLEQVAAYLTGPAPQPLVVTGESGVGKSTLLARVVQNVAQAHPQAVVVTRFIGITPETGSLADLLAGLRREIAECYGQAPPEPLGDLSQQVAAFAAYLRTQSPPVERPLILVVDALDQLGSERQRVDWLPPVLAPSERVVVSVSSGRQELDTLRTWLPAEQILQLDPLTRAQGAAALRQWLAAEERQLTPTQETVVLDGFAPMSEGKAGTGTPLYLRLAFEQARAWRSFDPVKPLPLTVPALLGQYFKRLEEPGQHGRELVAYALGYLAAAKHGLAEDELLDLLSSSEPVRTALQELSPGSPPINAERPLPMALWARLAADLERSLTFREADGARLVTLYHQQVRAEAEQLYLAGTERPARHAELAAYFGEQPYQLSAGGGVWNRRKLAELAYQQAKARPEAREALEATLTDGRFLEGKLAVEGVAAALEDLRSAHDNEDIDRIARAIRAGAIPLANNPAELPNQITGRVGPAVRLHDLPERTTPWLRLRSQSLTPPDPALRHLLQGHTGPVTACTLSANGKRALSGDEDGTLRLWDTASGETLRFLGGHSNRITSCALSADGMLALSASADGTLRVWDTASGETLRIVLWPTGEVIACALSADGTLALAGDKDGMLRFWDTATDRTRHIWRLSSATLISCALSANGRVAITSSIGTEGGTWWLPFFLDMLWEMLRKNARTVRLWDTDGGQPLRSWQFSFFKDVVSCALSADGNRVIIASNQLGGVLGGRATLRVWDAASGRRVRTLKGFKGVVASCALSADGHLALSGSRIAYLGPMVESTAKESYLMTLLGTFRAYDHFEGSTLRVWDTASGKVVRILQGHKDSATLCVLSADGKLALSASSSLVDSTSLADLSEHRALRLWDIASEEPLPPPERYEGPLAGCVLSYDGCVALSFAQSDRELRVWDTGRGKIRHRLKHRQSVVSCALSADGRLALSIAYDAGLRLWDTESGKLLRTWVFPILMNVKCCALSANGRLALSPRAAGLCLWDTESGKTLSAFSSTESGKANNTLRWMRGFALSADGRRALFVSREGALELGDTEQGDMLCALEGQTENVDNWALSADGRRVLAAFQDGTLRIWNADSGREMHTLGGHTPDIVPSCALSATGRLALSASSDRTLRLWDTAKGQELARWTHEVQLRCCALSANGRIAAAGDIDGGIHFLEVVGVMQADDAFASHPPASWLAEKPSSKPSLVQGLFRRK